MHILKIANAITISCEPLVILSPPSIYFLGVTQPLNRYFDAAFGSIKVPSISGPATFLADVSIYGTVPFHEFFSTEREMGLSSFKKKNVA